MSARANRGATHKQYSLPADPVYLTFPRSDGDESTWYTNTTRQVDSDGHVNYYQPVGVNDNMAVKWRVQVGDALSGFLNLPTGRNYVLQDWPADFAMFDHHKGPADTPRHDIYLCGSKSRYRSVPEFIPHARWLMEDPTMDRANCGCKYCGKGKQSQTQISQSLGLTKNHNSSSPAPSPLPGRAKKLLTQSVGRPREVKPAQRAKPYAAVQRLPKAGKSRDAAVAPVRDRDLRAMHTDNPNNEPRKYRKGELLWCRIQPPILGPNGGLDSISMWPGTVLEYSLRVTTDDAEAGSSELWSTTQCPVYKMELLGTRQQFFMSDEHVLPFQAYSVPNELEKALRQFTNDGDIAASSTFTPLGPPSSPHSFKDAAAPFIFAVETGRKLGSFWALTDEWEFKKIIHPSPSPSSASLSSLDALSEAINATVNGSISSAPLSRRPHSATGPSDISPEALVALSNRVLGRQHIIPPHVPITQSQTRYQGLWWGPERIWLGEMVRLKIARKQMGKAADLFPPSLPPPHVVELLRAQGNTEDLSANTRGVFMRLEGLFAVEVPAEHGVSKEVRASGMLYELADAEYIETEPSNLVNGNGNGSVSGKDKENAHASTSTSPSRSALGPNPTQLPNFDPSVPVSETTNAVLAQAAGQEIPEKKPDPSIHPLNEFPHPLPAPPIGYKFRPILPKGHEFCVSLSLISGRYYPGLLGHPIVSPLIQASLKDVSLLNQNYLWALDGMVSGYFNSVDPEVWKPSREIMMTDAEKSVAARYEVYRQGNAQMEDAQVAEALGFSQDVSM